ncbi:DNA alkylation repair protein [Marisediminicola sp. LYQ85]|uniref:DNA alkylation repair protein n=1 Tax=Marisediminicola sp. LYQ85 TaxID=3391062 RepID=UPI003983840B
MSAAADFIVSRLEAESDPYRAEAEAQRLGGGLLVLGASVGAVRGTVRDALHKFAPLGRDDIASLASELWAGIVFEHRLAAVVLLQTRVTELDNSDLTRIEGFVRSGRHAALVEPLCRDVVGPLVRALDGGGRAKAETTIERWAHEPDAWVRRAASLIADHVVAAGADGGATGGVEPWGRRVRAAVAAASDGRR